MKLDRYIECGSLSSEILENLGGAFVCDIGGFHASRKRNVSEFDGADIRSIRAYGYRSERGFVYKIGVRRHDFPFLRELAPIISASIARRFHEDRMYTFTR